MREISSELTDWLLQIGFMLPNWKWIAIALSVLGGLILLSIGNHILRYIQSRISRNDSLPKIVLYFFQQDIHSPGSWILALLFWYSSLQILNLHDGVTKALVALLHFLTVIHIIRLLYMGVDAAGYALADFVKKTENTLDDELAPFATKVLKIIVITLGIVLALQSFGFNVGALLAGLGIGSLALALAAQDTAANLFGSITVILDRPFQRGDYIKIGDTEGIVEEVGFRSTRIRTHYKSLVTIPNATVAKEKIDNMGVRPARRIRHLIGISYETPIEKINSFLERIRYSLKQNPSLLPNEHIVSFQTLGDFDLKILVNCFVVTNESEVEFRVQQEILLDILKIAGEMGVEFAYPTQTLHLRNPSV